MNRIAGVTPDQLRGLLDLRDRVAQHDKLIKSLSARFTTNVDQASPPLFFRNTSGETIPPYACMQVTGTSVDTGRTYFDVTKPSDVDGTSGPYLFNIHREVSPGEYGISDAGIESRASVSGGTISSGTRLIPVVDSWSLESDDEGQYMAAGVDSLGSSVYRVFFVGDTSDPAESRRIKFTTTAKIENREVAAVVTSSASGAVSVGDSIVVYDTQNRFSEIESNATGMAFFRIPTDADPSGTEPRWEIEDCTLPAKRIMIKFKECLKTFDLLADVELAEAPEWPLRSAFPGVDPAPEFQDGQGPTELEVFNPFGFTSIKNRFGVAERVTDANFSEFDNDTVPKARSSTASRWEIIHVSDPIAKHAVFVHNGGGQFSLKTGSHFNGGNPAECWDSQYVPATCLFPCDCLDEDEEVLGIYDEWNDEYKIAASASALLGTPETLPNVPIGLAAPGGGAAGCGYNVTRQNACVFLAPGTQSTTGQISIGGSTVNVVSGAYLGDDGLCFIYTPVISCGGGSSSESCIPVTECEEPAPDCSGEATYVGVDDGAGSFRWEIQTPCPAGCTSVTPSGTPPGQGAIRTAPCSVST